MDPLTLGLLIGGGAGLIKGFAVDMPREARDRKLAAETQRYSPWTGLKADPVKPADPFGSSLQGGMAGAQFGQGVQAHQDAQKLQTQMGDYFTGQTSVRDPGMGQSFWHERPNASGTGNYYSLFNKGEGRF